MYGFQKENKTGSKVYYSRKLPSGKFVVALIRKKTKVNGDKFYVNITLRRENFQVGKSLDRFQTTDFNEAKEHLTDWMKREHLKILFL